MKLIFTQIAKERMVIRTRVQGPIIGYANIPRGTGSGFTGLCCLEWLVLLLLLPFFKSSASLYRLIQ